MTARTSPARRRRTVLLAAALLPLALVATACGSGLNPQTYRERTTQDATNASAGDLALRDLAILPPQNGAAELAAGSDARATLTIGNPSGTPDRLVQVTTDAASSVDLIDPSGQPTQAVDVPAQGTAGGQEFSLALRGLTKPLRPGMYVSMTFVFDRNGRRTLLVPVRMYDSPLPRASYSPKSSEGE